MAEADSGVAVALVSVEAVSVVVIAACLRHAVGARMPGRVRRAVTGPTRTRDLGACDLALQAVRADQWLRGGHCAPPTLAVVGALLRSAAITPGGPLRLLVFDPNLTEARGNRSTQIARPPLGTHR